MACLRPGRVIEATRLVLPTRLEEAAIALEDIIPALVNAAEGVGDCRTVAAITDKFESCAFEQTYIESVPDAGGPIMPLEGQGPTRALLDSWLAKGTLLGDDGSVSVFVAFMDVMRRPQQRSWSVETITIMGTKQTLASLFEELQEDEAYALSPSARH